jgi:hypothetical protein
MTRSVRHILITISVGTMIAIGASTAVAATHAAIGTWKLNLAKSTDESTDPLPKSETFVFADSAQGVSLSTRIVGADGKLAATKGKPVKWDGAAHPETTGPDHDSITVKPAGAQTIEWSMAKNGTLVRSGILTVSRDGKMMTVSGASVAGSGAKTYFNNVYDRE